MHTHTETHVHTLTHTCSYAARLDIQPDSDLLTNTGREIRLVPGSGSRLGWGWQLKGRTGLRDTGSRLGGEVGTAGAPIQGPWTEGRGMGGCWDREARPGADPRVN